MEGGREESVEGFAKGSNRFSGQRRPGFGKRISCSLRDYLGFAKTAGCCRKSGVKMKSIKSIVFLVVLTGFVLDSVTGELTKLHHFE